jgi:uncharacterized coiled-coil DUF342 family protein
VPEVADTPEITHMPDMTDMPEETLQHRTERLTALVAVLQGERDKALQELTVCRAERDQMAAMLVQIETNAAETLGTAELSPESTINELSQELDESSKALHEMKAELDRTKEDLARAEFKVRGQTAKMRRQSGQGAGQH